MTEAFTSQVIFDVLNHYNSTTQLPADLQTRLRGVQLAQELQATRRGQYKIRDLLKNYTAPLRSKQDFEAEIGAWRAHLLDEENTKKVLRKAFEKMTGSEANCPPELRKKTVLDAKNVVGTQHNVVYGLNPFTNEKEKLEYQDKEVWADFKDKAVESVNVGDKQVLIPSLTVEKLIAQAELAGLSLQSLGRLARCFVEAALPAVATKVNNIHDENVSEIFNVIEAAIDVENEIQIVEKSLDEVERKPGKFDLTDVVNVYTKKQHILIQLRTGFAMNSAEQRKRVQQAADSLGLQALYNLVSPETKMFLLEDIQQRYSMSGQECTLERMLMEASTAEKNKPEWRIKTKMKPPSRVYGTVQAAPVGAEEPNVNTIGGGPDEKDDDAEDGVLEENDEDFEDQQFEDADGELFYLSKVRRVHMRPSKRPTSPGGRRHISSSPYRGRVTMVKRYESRPPAPSRPQSPGNKRQGKDSGGRGKPVWKKLPRNDRKNNNAAPGRTRSKSPRKKKCLRCNSENHLGDKCPRYGKYCATICNYCKKLGLIQYHPDELCLRNGKSNWRSPNSRSTSPATQMKYGFKQRRGLSPLPSPKNG